LRRPDPVKYILNDLQIDTGRQLVSRADDPIPVPKLSYDLLLVLVRAAPNLVSLDELMRLVWPGIIVSPETVSQRIKLLRDALDDDPRVPRYIAGLRGRGYQMVAAVEVIVDGPAVLPPAPISAKSVAILPFLDMSENKDQEHFSDGLTEELINRLSKIPDMRVPARTSSFYFKGKSEDIPTIAKKLMVAHVLEGSVRKSGDRLRVTAQLVRVDNGYHLWSETYDRRLDDVFKVQDDIAAAVVKALKVSLLDAGVPHIAPTANSEAYTLYLQAGSLAKRNSSADSLRAYDYLNQALRLDPRFALAWAALAELYANDSVEWGKIFPPDDGTGQNLDLSATKFALGSNRVSIAAHDAGARALALDPNEADIHRSMARVMWWFDFNWDAADAELKKARALDPGSARIYEQSAQLAFTMGRLIEGLELANDAVTLDPLGTVYFDIGAAYHRLGVFDQAAAAYRHLIEIHPTKAGAHFRYGLVLLSQHEPQAALEQFERDEPWYREAGVPLALDALGRHCDAGRALAIAERNWGTGMAYQISYVYAARGDVDRAVAWLERAYRQRDAGLLTITHDPMLKSLTGNPWFEALLRRLRLPE
jgi:TolB-like protein